MYLLLDLFYFLGAIAAAPFLIAKSRRTGKYRSGWAGRFGFGPDLFPEGTRRPMQARVLLLHCVSVGELDSVQTLIKRLLAADPHLHIALTTTTDTGTERAQKLFPDSSARVHPFRFPLDFSFAVEMLFDRVQPDAIALVELETWPNFLAIAQSRRIPVALINGRLSERSFPRYRLIRPLMKSMLRKLTWIAVQTPTMAGRFRALGAPPERLEILPTLKYDNAQIPNNSATAELVPGQEALAGAMGLSPAHKLFVAGSIAPGEEIPLLDAYLALRGKYPVLRLALVPRHPEAVPQMLAAIEGKGLSPVLRTNRPDAVLPALTMHNQGSAPGSAGGYGGSHERPPLFQRNPPAEPGANGGIATGARSGTPALSASEVFVLNTMGELRKLYALAFATFIGRSLVNLGGSDMIEAAALAKPTCFGPHTHNFTEVVELLVKNQAAIVVEDTESLTATLDHWLSNPAAAQAQGLKAQLLIQQQQGSTLHYVQRLLTLMEMKVD